MSETSLAPTRKDYLLGLVLVVLLLCAPTYARWAGPAALISQNEFDPWLGLGGDRRIAQLLHTLLWLAYAMLYRAIGNSQSSVPLRVTVTVWIIFLAAPPWMSPDVFFYLAKGHLTHAYGINAHVSTISAAGSIATDPIFQAVVPSIRDIVGNYGPAFHLLSMTVASLSYGNALLGLAIFKLIAALCTVGCIVVVRRFAEELDNGHGARTGMLLALHPIVLFNFLAAAHNDSLVMLLLLSGLLALHRRRESVAGLLIGLSVTIKPIAVFIVPGIAAYLIANRTNRSLPRTLLALCVSGAAGAILPFAFSPTSLTFLTNIATSQNQGTRATIHLATAMVGLSLDHSLLLMRLTFIGVAAYRLPTLYRQHSQTPLLMLLLASFELLILAQILTMQSMTEWYVFWPLCFAACIPTSASRRWSDSVAAYYMPLAAWHVVGPWTTVLLTQVSLVGFQLRAALYYFRGTAHPQNNLPVSAS